MPGRVGSGHLTSRFPLLSRGEPFRPAPSFPLNCAYSSRGRAPSALRPFVPPHCALHADLFRERFRLIFHPRSLRIQCESRRFLSAFFPRDRKRATCAVNSRVFARVFARGCAPACACAFPRSFRPHFDLNQPSFSPLFVLFSSSVRRLFSTFFLC